MKQHPIQPKHLLMYYLLSPFAIVGWYYIIKHYRKEEMLWRSEMKLGKRGLTTN